jgi:hypothetical protein
MDIFPSAAVSTLSLQPPRQLRKKTHAALQLEVFPRGVPMELTSAPILTSRRVHHKSHRDLRDEVFPGGIVPLRQVPLDIVDEEDAASAPLPVQRMRSTRTRSGTVSQRPLPAPPASASSPVNVSPASRRPLGPPPVQGLPLRPISRRMSVSQTGAPPTQALPALPILPSLSEDSAIVVDQSSSLRRSQSTSHSYATPPHAESLQRSRSNVDRTRTGLPSSPAPRQRNSIVLERARAYNGQSGGPLADASKGQIMGTLNQFPLPPLPPLPGSLDGRAVQKLDRSKFSAFAS